jgi:MYXO-CTERM domain-containing protein
MFDAGTPDAGFISDAGAITDAGSTDAGSITDAGTGLDAGAVLVSDAGMTDGGTTTPEIPQGCGCSSDGGALTLLALLMLVRTRFMGRLRPS